jgi:hypothetical protein
VCGDMCAVGGKRQAGAEVREDFGHVRVRLGAIYGTNLADLVNGRKGQAPLHFGPFTASTTA